MIDSQKCADININERNKIIVETNTNNLKFICDKNKEFIEKDIDYVNNNYCNKFDS